MLLIKEMKDGSEAGSLSTDAFINHPSIALRVCYCLTSLL